MFITKLTERLRHTIQKVKIIKSEDPNAPSLDIGDYVIVEKSIAVNVDQVGQFTLLCTPNNLKKLVVGFLYSQNLINDINDIAEIKQHKTSIDVKLAAPKAETYDLKKDLEATYQIEKTLCMKLSQLTELMQNLNDKQRLFKITGSTHAAAIFNRDGDFLIMHEDVGRHNALDKSIGECMLLKKDLKGCGAVLSSRVSFEMLNKAAKAGLEIVIAASAPSSLAVELANKWNITLCGFTRGKRVNVYTHSDRIKF
jgi:FdhD protein